MLKIGSRVNKQREVESYLKKMRYANNNTLEGGKEESLLIVSFHQKLLFTGLFFP